MTSFTPHPETDLEQKRKHSTTNDSMTRATTEVHPFFSEVPQLGSLRFLPKLI